MTFIFFGEKEYSRGIRTVAAACWRGGWAGEPVMAEAEEDDTQNLGRWI
jgi:hypothetical protein